MAGESLTVEFAWFRTEKETKSKGGYNLSRSLKGSKERMVGGKRIKFSKRKALSAKLKSSL